ncbi:hypothetical protein P8C59_009453 [Phyllachora maydis]|uniref:Uncharacterized protein n=1 Tax=Phyllachora maydis TaxID=1825666 RepID=A0AAD9ICN1_9PEZI|nr:hypothetical protein P8C59_009453 [Phyllachora maydis]
MYSKIVLPATAIATEGCKALGGATQSDRKVQDIHPLHPLPSPQPPLHTSPKRPVRTARGSLRWAFSRAVLEDMAEEDAASHASGKIPWGCRAPDNTVEIPSTADLLRSVSAALSSAAKPPAPPAARPQGRRVVRINLNKLPQISVPIPPVARVPSPHRAASSTSCSRSRDGRGSGPLECVSEDFESSLDWDEYQDVSLVSVSTFSSDRGARAGKKSFSARLADIVEEMGQADQAVGDFAQILPLSGPGAEECGSTGMSDSTLACLRSQVAFIRDFLAQPNQPADMIEKATRKLNDIQGQLAAAVERLEASIRGDVPSEPASASSEDTEPTVERRLVSHAGFLLGLLADPATSDDIVAKAVQDLRTVKTRLDALGRVGEASVKGSARSQSAPVEGIARSQSASSEPSGEPTLVRLESQAKALLDILADPATSDERVTKAVHEFGAVQEQLAARARADDGDDEASVGGSAPSQSGSESSGEPISQSGSESSVEPTLVRLETQAAFLRSVLAYSGTSADHLAKATQDLHAVQEQLAALQRVEASPRCDAVQEQLAVPERVVASPERDALSGSASSDSGSEDSEPTIERLRAHEAFICETLEWPGQPADMAARATKKLAELRARITALETGLVESAPEPVDEPQPSPERSTESAPEPVDEPQPSPERSTESAPEPVEEPQPSPERSTESAPPAMNEPQPTLERSIESAPEPVEEEPRPTSPEGSVLSASSSASSQQEPTIECLRGHEAFICEMLTWPDQPADMVERANKELGEVRARISALEGIPVAAASCRQVPNHMQYVAEHFARLVAADKVAPVAAPAPTPDPASPSTFGCWAKFGLAAVSLATAAAAGFVPPAPGGDFTNPTRSLARRPAGDK